MRPLLGGVKRSGESEWMWVRVEPANDRARVVFGRLDIEPLATTTLRHDPGLAVSYDNIREHMKPSAFNQ